MFPWHRKSSVWSDPLEAVWLWLTTISLSEPAAKSPRKEMLILSISSGSSAHLQIRWSQSPPTSGDSSADTNNCANRFATYLHHSSSFHLLPDLISVTEIPPDGNNLMSNKSQLSQSESIYRSFCCASESHSATPPLLLIWYQLCSVVDGFLLLLGKRHHQI